MLESKRKLSLEIIIVVLMSYIIGIWLTKSLGLMVFVAVFFMVLGFILLTSRYEYLYLCIVLILPVLNIPSTVSFGPVKYFGPFTLALGLLGVIVVLRELGFLNFRFLSSFNLFLPVLGFLFFAILSLSKILSLQLSVLYLKKYFARMLLFPLFSFALFYSIPNERRKIAFFKKMSFITIILGIVGVVLSIFQALWGKFFLFSKDYLYMGEVKRAMGLSASAGRWGVYLITCSLLSLSFFLHANKKGKAIWLFVFLFLLIGALLSQLRSGWLGIIAGTLCLLYITRRTSRKKIRIFWLLLLVMTMILFAYTTEIREIINMRVRLDASIGDRIVLLNKGIKLFLQHPLIGIGIGNFPVYIKKYGLVSLDGIPWHHEIALKEMEAHNMYLAFLVETGILGFIFFLWIIYRGWRNFSCFRNAEQETYHALPQMVYGFHASYLGTLVAGIGGDVQTHVFFWWLLGISAMVYSFSLKEKQTI